MVKATSKQKRTVVILVIVSLLIIVGTGVAGFLVAKSHDPEITFGKFINEGWKYHRRKVF